MPSRERSELLDKIADLDGSVLLFDLLDTLDAVKYSARTESLYNLEDLLGELLEGFSATSAWLFIRHDALLVPRVTINAPTHASVITPQSISTGIVGRVFKTARPYFSNDVHNDKYYHEWLTDTESEIAAPLIHPATHTPIGVINIESTDSPVFAHSHLKELEVAALRLVPDSLTLSELEAYDVYGRKLRLRGEATGWHPAIHRWSLTRLLQAVCKAVSTHLGQHFRDTTSDVTYPDPTCTVWRHDASKECLRVLATSKYDHQYLSESVLGLNSFTGRSLQQPLSAPALSDRPQALVRKDKALRRGIGAVTSVPFQLPSRNGNGHRADNDGTLNIYSYDRKNDEIPQPQDELMRSTADLVASSIDGAHRQRCVRARAEVERRLTYVGNGVDIAPEQLTRILMEILSSDGCSLFRRIGTQLVCIATSGLIENGRRLNDLSAATYDMVVPDDDGFTTYLGKNGNTIIRKNDVANQSESTTITTKGVPSSSSLRPCLKFRESGAEVDPHSRFLGMSIADDASSVIGVVRLNRVSQNPRYDSMDEDVLAFVESTIASVLAGHTSRRTMQEEPLAPLWMPLPHYQVSPKLVITDVLRSLVEHFKEEHLAIQANLSIVCEGGADDDPSRALVLFSHYSRLHQGLVFADEGSCRDSQTTAYESDESALRETEHSVRWQAVKSGKILQYDREICEKSGAFSGINPDARHVKSGICVPIQCLLSNAQVLRCVLSVDCAEEPREWTSKEMRILLAGSRRIDSVFGGVPSDWQQHLRELRDSTSISFLLGQLRAGTDADWVTMEFGDQPTHQLQVVRPRSHVVNPIGSSANSWRRVQGILGSYGVSTMNGGRWCRFPLKHGAAISAHLSCGNGDSTFTDKAVDSIVRTTGLWSEISRGLSGVWTPEIRRVRDDHLLGMYEWRIDDEHCGWESGFIQSCRRQLELLP